VAVIEPRWCFERRDVSGVAQYFVIAFAEMPVIASNDGFPGKHHCPIKFKVVFFADNDIFGTDVRYDTVHFVSVGIRNVEPHAGFLPEGFAELRKQIHTSKLQAMRYIASK